METSLLFQQQFLDTIPVPIFLKNEKYIYIECNKSFEEFLGMDRQDIIGKSVHDLAPAKLAAIYHEKDSELMNNPGVQIYEFEVEKKNKENRRVIFHKATFERDDGQPAGLIGVILDITERKKAEDDLRETTHNLGERVKELNCMYGISKLIEKENISVEKILQGTADIIPPSWQYPKITCAQVKLDGQSYRTKTFKETEWHQSQEIIVHGEKAGAVEIYYLEEKPEIDEGPFLKEERLLINTIAERLGHIVERYRAVDEVKILKGIIPICSYCKEIRDDKGFWNRVEAYIENHTEASFSHGICPKCVKEHFPDFFDRKKK